MKRVNLLLVLLAALALAACSKSDASQTDPEQEPGAGKGKAEKTPQPQKQQKNQKIRKTKKAEARPASSTRTTASAAERLKHWHAVHAFLGAPAKTGRVVAESEAVVITKDNHVGVTQNAGASWNFVRITNGSVTAVGGFKGGPYLAAGKRGLISISQKGHTWRDLPRYTGDDLIDVAASGKIAVFIGKRGGLVTINRQGKEPQRGLLPKFKPRRIDVVDGVFYVTRGKKGYSSKDGVSWSVIDDMPALPSYKVAATSKGVCSIGKVGKRRGVKCSVVGKATGLAEGVTAVVGKKTISISVDGAKSWRTAAAPFRGVQAIVGTGPYFALGKGGHIARSDDGQSWKNIALNTRKTLRDGVVNGKQVVVVGDRGTIAVSQDAGVSFQVLDAVSRSNLSRILAGKTGYLIPQKKTVLVSADGLSWTEAEDPAVILAAIPDRAKPGKCETRLPAVGERCTFGRKATTPMGLPSVSRIHFKGEIGLALGDAGLVAFTQSGGADWNVKHGFKFRDLRDFKKRGKRIVAIGGKTVLFSKDAGKSFKVAQLPKKIGTIKRLLLADGGVVYAAGTNGTILKASGELTAWEKLTVYKKNRTSYVGLYQVGDAIFAAGSKGQLHRSTNGGANWHNVATGIRGPVIAMTAEHDKVIALAKTSGRTTRTYLLSSTSKGRYFVVNQELSRASYYGVRRFSLKQGILRYNELRSTDLGATWRKDTDDRWVGAQPIGNGVRISAYNGGAKYKSKFYVVGTDNDDWTLVDSFYNYNANFHCDRASGCWMVSGGKVYRPIAL